MKPKNSAVRKLGAAILLAAIAATPAFVSADLIVDRGLPTSSLNNASVAWGGYLDTDGVSWLTGDTFSMPALDAGHYWTIDTIRIWSPAIPVGNNELGDFYNSITLYTGVYEQDNPRTTPLQQRSTGTISGNSSDNSNIHFTKVSYADGTDYPGYQLWQVDFTNLNWVVDPRDLLEFGVNASGSDFWYNHASYAALSGSPQDGADGVFSQISEDGVTSFDVNSATDSLYNWEGKSSDINVQVFATPVPGALPLAVIGLFGLTAIRRTRAKAGVTIQPAC